LTSERTPRNLLWKISLSLSFLAFSPRYFSSISYPQKTSPGVSDLGSRDHAPESALDLYPAGKPVVLYRAIFYVRDVLCSIHSELSFPTVLLADISAAPDLISPFFSFLYILCSIYLVGCILSRVIPPILSSLSTNASKISFYI
jgi:hypothetical protein